jgi:hypothetical protein
MKKQSARPVHRSAKDQILFDAQVAITDLINDWEAPDSPESFCFSMKGLMVIRDRIKAHLQIK